MQYEKDKMTAKAEKWLETATDDEDIEDVQHLLTRIEPMDEGQRLQNRLDTLNTYIKGTSMRITLNAAQEAQKVTIVETLESVFKQLPNLSVPRIRSNENLLEKVELAMKENIKAESK